ncbi:MAG: hypothetical protein mread185_000159 [Mycoplasmataceae bacterium]|nr:MAG: hypothetical protein mread185_000159 [Mycoplasmataceae bacterium]
MFGTIILWSLAIIGALALIFLAYGWITTTDKGKKKGEEAVEKAKDKVKDKL